MRTAPAEYTSDIRITSARYGVIGRCNKCGRDARVYPVTGTVHWMESGNWTNARWCERCIEATSTHPDPFGIDSVVPGPDFRPGERYTRDGLVREIVKILNTRGQERPVPPANGQYTVIWRATANGKSRTAPARSWRRWIAGAVKVT